jgi:hypothetical protein
MGEVTNTELLQEIRRTRVELGEVRDLAEAALMSIVGKDKVRNYQMEAAVQDRQRRERYGTPLRRLFGGRILDALEFEGDGFGVVTVEELVRQYSRDQVAAVPGMGPSRLSKLDNVVAERKLSWAEAV